MRFLNSETLRDGQSPGYFISKTEIPDGLSKFNYSKVKYKISKNRLTELLYSADFTSFF